MRLIEQQPSWALHAYLRFSDIRYVTEFTPSFKALGRNLPIVVDGYTVQSEEEALISIADKTNNNVAGLSYDVVLSKYLKSSLSKVFSQLVQNNGDFREDVFNSSPAGINSIFGAMYHLRKAVNGDT